MNPRLKASRAAIELIKRFEGFRPAAAQLPDGRWTIGHGHTKTARQGVEITEADAEVLLLYDLMDVQAAINDAAFTPLTQNQFDALTAFVFNVGLENFKRSSVLRRLNEGNMVQAACAIEMWRKADLDGERIVVDALVRRRSAEKTLFLTPMGGWNPAPSPVVRPRVDYDVGASLPRTSTEAALELTSGRLTAHRTGPATVQDAPAVAAAAEAVAARLQALNLAEADAGLDLGPAPAAPLEDGPASQPTPPEAAAPQPFAIPHPPAPEPFAAEPVRSPFTLTPNLEPLAEPAPQLSIPAPAPLDEPRLFDETPADFPSHIPADASRRIVRREAPMEIDESPFGDDGVKVGGLPLLGLGFMGLAVFGGSVFWGVNAKGSGGVLDPMVVASVLGLIGIALVASAVYFLLVKLGGRGE